MDNKVSVFRKESFNAAHRLFNPGWDDERNSRVFGKCANRNFHGHNYELEVKLTGVPDPSTGFVIDLKLLGDIIKEEVIERFDHRNLNEDCPEFRDIIPSAENIAIVIYGLLRRRIDPRMDMKVRLYETKKNFVEYPAH